MYYVISKFGKKIYVYVIGFKIWFMYFKRHLGLSESITSESKPSVKIHTFKMNAPLEIKWTKNHFFALVWKLDFCSNNVIQKLGWILCIDFFFSSFLYWLGSPGRRCEIDVDSLKNPNEVKKMREYMKIRKFWLQNKRYTLQSKYVNSVPNVEIGLIRFRFAGILFCRYSILQVFATLDWTISFDPPCFWSEFRGRLPHPPGGMGPNCLCYWTCPMDTWSHMIPKQSYQLWKPYSQIVKYC